MQINQIIYIYHGQAVFWDINLVDDQYSGIQVVYKRSTHLYSFTVAYIIIITVCIPNYIILVKDEMVQNPIE